MAKYNVDVVVTASVQVEVEIADTELQGLNQGAIDLKVSEAGENVVQNMLDNSNYSEFDNWEIDVQDYNEVEE